MCHRPILESKSDTAGTSKINLSGILLPHLSSQNPLGKFHLIVNLSFLNSFIEFCMKIIYCVINIFQKDMFTLSLELRNTSCSHLPLAPQVLEVCSKIQGGPGSLAVVVSSCSNYSLVASQQSQETLTR